MVRLERSFEVRKRSVKKRKKKEKVCSWDEMREGRKRRREKMGDGAEERGRKVTRSLFEPGRTARQLGIGGSLLWTFEIQISRAYHPTDHQRKDISWKETEEQKETRPPPPQAPLSSCLV